MPKSSLCFSASVSLATDRHCERSYDVPAAFPFQHNPDRCVSSSPGSFWLAAEFLPCCYEKKNKRSKRKEYARFAFLQMQDEIIEQGR